MIIWPKCGHVSLSSKELYSFSLKGINNIQYAISQWKTHKNAHNCVAQKCLFLLFLILILNDLVTFIFS